jgi:GNAT superfamily N-acetyltransferase
VFDIKLDDLSGAPTRGLLAIHLAGMHADSPPGHVFALDLSGLQRPDVTVWSVWLDGRIAAIGAMRDLGGGMGELKSMRTHPDCLRRGAAAALLRHMIGEARQRPGVRAGFGAVPAIRVCRWGGVRGVRAERVQPVPASGAMIRPEARR